MTENNHHTEPKVDVQQIMRHVKRTAAREQHTLESSLHLPRSHRSGFMGKIANVVLSKLYLATTSFLRRVLATQDSFNRGVRRSLARHHRILADLERVTGIQEDDADSFDQLAFAARFRGPEAVVKKRQESYLQYFRGASPVVDIGCGRGEFLELLRDHDVRAVGVELSPVFVKHCEEKGLTVHEQDALDFLSEATPDSLGGVFASHVIEHVSTSYLVRLLRAAHRALRPGGHFIAESPNPKSLAIFANAFYVDPTHLKPVHPEQLQFMLQSAGFTHTEISFREPLSPDQQLELLPEHPDTALHNRNVKKLNEVLYGPQDYAIIAKK